MTDTFVTQRTYGDPRETEDSNDEKSFVPALANGYGL